MNMMDMTEFGVAHFGIITIEIVKPGKSLYSTWYCMCSCQPTVGLAILVVIKIFFIAAVAYSTVNEA